MMLLKIRAYYDKSVSLHHREHEVLCEILFMLILL